jgi:hypothetical protein
MRNFFCNQAVGNSNECLISDFPQNTPQFVWLPRLPKNILPPSSGQKPHSPTSLNITKQEVISVSTHANPWTLHVLPVPAKDLLKYFVMMWKKLLVSHLYVSTYSILMHHQSITLMAQLSTYKIRKNQKFTLILPKIGSNVSATLDVQPNSVHGSGGLKLHLLMCRRGISVKVISFDICCSNANKYHISLCD